MNHKNKIITGFCTGIACCFLPGCGGGDSDNNSGADARNVHGTWTGALTKVSDTCGSNSNSTLNFSHSVTQNEGAVTLVSNGVEYLGNIVGSDGFSVDADQSNQANCSDADRIEYEQIDSNEDTTATVDFRVTRTCASSDDSCEIAYTGTAARNGGVSPTSTPTGQVTPGSDATATPTPNGTTTPLPTNSGCQAINPKTKAGVYQGDGGCGVSETNYNYSSSQNLVTLEPFGANGATSFAVSSSNTSAAASNRTDLTISGEAGYACTLACSAPGTFTVRCTKEGGVSCVEKF